MVDISVIVPARDAEHLLPRCLSSIARSNPRELIVVDGMSTDNTVEIARRHGATVLSDEGRGLPAARRLGAEAATSSFVALIDADVVLPDNALAHLLDELLKGDYVALQAGLLSESGPGYWGRALVNHHRSGRSKDWFGLVATVFRRADLLAHGFNEQFLSGEDMDLRWRLERAGARVGVSRETIVTHVFEDSFEFARAQWLADGHGFGRMLTTYRWRAAWLLAVPLAACIRGVSLSLARMQARWIPYYLCFMLFNYVGMFEELTGERYPGAQRQGGPRQFGSI